LHQRDSSPGRTSLSLRSHTGIFYCKTLLCGCKTLLLLNAIINGFCCKGLCLYARASIAMCRMLYNYSQQVGPNTPTPLPEPSETINLRNYNDKSQKDNCHNFRTSAGVFEPPTKYATICRIACSASGSRKEGLDPLFRIEFGLTVGGRYNRRLLIQPWRLWALVPHCLTR
jgi:hypothetical protein